MMIDGGTVIVLVYLLVSVGVIVAFVLIFAGGLEWFADRLRERRRSQRVHQPATYYNEVRTHVSLGKDTPCTRPIERFGDIVAYPILGGLHHRYARI